MADTSAIWARICAFGEGLPSENALLELIEKKGGPRRSTLRSIKFGHAPTDETLERIAATVEPETTAIYLRYGYRWAKTPANLESVDRCWKEGAHV